MADAKKSAPADTSAIPDPARGPQPWWFRDVIIPTLIAVVVGMSIAGQAFIDDNRAARDQEAAEALSHELSRLEDLRFVRERSAGLEPIVGGNGNPLAKTLPFMGMDLQGQDLSFMDLRGADFTSANLNGVNFFKANLKDALFWDVELINTNFVDAELDGATFYRSALKGVDLTGSNGAVFIDVCWDEETISPPTPDEHPESICADMLPDQ